MKRLTIALAGNPNSGKTTIFNDLTGARQKVGNWPGVTVEKKEGRLKRNGYDLKIVDLPGTYSLTPFSMEEITARDFILNEKPDVVINIIDAANLERSLYLAMQILELDRPVVFVLNMADLAKSKGMTIDEKKLSQLLNLPVVFTVASKGKGIDTLIETAIREAESFPEGKTGRKVVYNREINKMIEVLENSLDRNFKELIVYPNRWTAIKLLENDEVVKANLRKISEERSDEILKLVKNFRKHIKELFQDDPEIVLTDECYGFIAGIVRETLLVSSRKKTDISRNIDLVLTNRFLGLPIFIFFIWLMFQLTFSLGAYPTAWINSLVSLLSSFLGGILSHGILKDLILNGIVAGIGSVIIFLPNILILFFCIALFEDTGYMARAAFLMDRIMHLIGLHGKSFIPMLMGFGCNVPAIMATRTLESRKDRILTILITPFMSCSARLPVYIILAGTFFGDRAGSVIFGLYLTGILVAIASGRLLRATLLKGADAPFVMELPPYRIPMFKSLMIHMWDRSKMFLKKMGGVILVGSIVIWALFTFPRTINFSHDYSKAINNIKLELSSKISSFKNNQLSNDNQSSGANQLKQKLKTEAGIKIAELENERDQEQASNSYIGRIGRAVEPFFKPVGIDWRSGVALIAGVVAKEVVVSTIGVLYGVGGKKPEVLKKAIRNSGMTGLSALSMMIFVLLYIPCIATVTAIWKEASLSWACFTLFYTTMVAWSSSFLVYQAGLLLGFT